jgi:hypothetical protein
MVSGRYLLFMTKIKNTHIKMTKRQQNIDSFTKAINKVIEKFHSNPFFFFYEEDIKNYFYSHLLDSCEEEEFPVRSDFAKKLIIKKVKSIPIKLEYPFNRGATSKYDVTLIEPIGDNHYEMPSSIAVELKLGAKGNDQCGPYKDDLLKLILFRSTSKLQNNLGISIYFYQSSLKQLDIEKWLVDFNYNISCKIPSELILSDNNVCSIIVPSNTKIFFIQNISLAKKI